MFSKSEISFQYPLSQLSMSLAEPDGTHQSQFFHKDVEHGTEYLKDSVCAADGKAAVHKVKPLKSTFNEFAALLLNMLYQMEVNQKEMMLCLTFMKTIQ